jgi:hypothetical protein
MATALVKGCIDAALATGCGCTWEVGRNFGAIAGCSKPETGGISCSGNADCVAASVSPAACEAYCCHGIDGKGPPNVHSAPSAPLKAAEGPCGAWQWRPGDTAELDGCWVSVEPSQQTLPFNEKATSGPWVGAQGNLGPNSSDWGATFLVVVIVASVLYMGVFGTLQWKSGRGAVPHRRFWRGLLAMAQDGIQFTTARLRGQSGRLAGSSGPSGSRKESSKRDSGHESGSKRGKRKEKRRSGDGRERASSAATTIATEPLLAPAPQPAASGTAAGDGGRWVHIPS